MTKWQNNLRMFLWMTLLTGLIYPLVVTGIAQLFLKQQADGDLVLVDGKPVGAKLIAQKFDTDMYFWARPSAGDYNPLSSGGSNLAPTSTALKTAVVERLQKLSKDHNAKTDEVPPELLFTSGSGLDPHIHRSTALFQVDRVAKARNMPRKELEELIDQQVFDPFWGSSEGHFVNVLLLNQALDATKAK